LVLKYDFAEQELAKLKEENLYRRLKRISLLHTSQAIVNGKQVINLSSNDYLGLSDNKSVLTETKKQLARISQCSSRLMSGNSVVIEQLEKHLASHRRTESSLVYPNGYMANMGVISVLGDKDSIIFSDELNHASIIDGCRLSGANVRVFNHNDMQHLEELIQTASTKRKIVITEGIFSMDGDMSNLLQICNIAKQHDAITIVDDAHGDFIFGASSRSSSFSGVPFYLGVNGDIDIHISSLSKGLGCFGGYVATTKMIRKLLINKSRQFIYTSALPDHLCISALSAMRKATKGSLQKKLFDNIAFMSKKLLQLGFRLKESGSQIIPVVIGDEKVAIDFSNLLLDNGIFVHAVRYPTVKKGSARLRISITASHNKNQLISVLDSFETFGKRLRII
jgi:glycine C-acetyltransferase